MNENQTPENKTVRPTKKQRELLDFINEFIGEHGYSPSYREIMTGCDYTSVATVALHVNSLIRRGHLRKRDRSARSLEVVAGNSEASLDETAEKKWLVAKVEKAFDEAEQPIGATGYENQHLETLVSALKVLGLEKESQIFADRLAKLRDI